MNPLLFESRYDGAVVTRARPRGCFVSVAQNAASAKTHLIASAVVRWYGQPRSQPRLVVETRCGRVMGAVNPIRTHLHEPDTHELCDNCSLAGLMPSYVVYRLFDAANRLLYIGYTGDFLVRVRDHYIHSNWWRHVDHWTFEPHDDLQSAVDAEIRAIQTELPRFNRQHNPAAA